MNACPIGEVFIAYTIIGIAECLYKCRCASWLLFLTKCKDGPCYQPRPEGTRFYAGLRSRRHGIASSTQSPGTYAVLRRRTRPPRSSYTQLRLKMPPRPFLVRLSRRSLLSAPSTRLYSSTTSEEPLIRITNLPAPNTGHIRILELNRPSARNAISRALLQSLRSEIDNVHSQYDASTGEELPPSSWNKRFGGIAGADEKGPTRALIVASAVDSSFCAGADLKERRGFSQEE